MAEEHEKKSSGCSLMVLYSSIFRRRSSHPPRRSSSAGSTPPCGGSNATLCHSHSKRRRSGSDEASLIVPVTAEPPPAVKSQITANAPIVPVYQKPPGRKPLEPAKVLPGPGTPVRLQSFGLTGDLENALYDHQRTMGSSNLVRASSGNVMLFGNLGNIRATGNGNAKSNAPPNHNVLDYMPRKARDQSANANGKYRDMGMVGPVAKSNAAEEEVAPVFCRALSKRLDPEELKEMGNEEYKQGRFAEALALYDRAIIMDPDKASYYGNKAAALIGLGRLLEAVAECREAVKLEPSYTRAHYRLATLYRRLGEADKAMHHYKLSRKEASSMDITQTQTLQVHLTKCSEARKLKDWLTVLEESQSAISSGADSAPQVFAAQAEALLKLLRHQDAGMALIDSPTFDIDASTKFFGAAGNACILAVRSQVDMVAGRFDDAVSVAHMAAQLDPGNKEVLSVVRRARAVASARSRGNELFKASEFEAACLAYGEGLDHDSHNSVLLCNRAACYSKLGQWEKAIKDCNIALSVRPSYTKARLRRADCNAKMERWQAAMKDYEELIQEMPGNEEIVRALSEAQIRFKKDNEEDVEERKYATNMIVVTKSDHLKHILSSSGLSVIYFCDNSSEAKQLMPFIERLCSRYPSVSFLKVDMEENPNIAKSEGVSVVPTFSIYKNCSKIKDIAGSEQDFLESSLKFFST